MSFHIMNNPIYTFMNNPQSFYYILNNYFNWMIIVKEEFQNICYIFLIKIVLFCETCKVTLMLIEFRNKVEIVKLRVLTSIGT